MTVKCENGKLVVARIMIGGLVDKQGKNTFKEIILELSFICVPQVLRTEKLNFISVENRRLTICFACRYYREQNYSV